MQMYLSGFSLNRNINIFAAPITNKKENYVKKKIADSKFVKTCDELVIISDLYSNLTCTSI